MTVAGPPRRCNPTAAGGPRARDSVGKRDARPRSGLSRGACAGIRARDPAAALVSESRDRGWWVASCAPFGQRRHFPQRPPAGSRGPAGLGWARGASPGSAYPRLLGPCGGRVPEDECGPEPPPSAGAGSPAPCRQRSGFKALRWLFAKELESGGRKLRAVSFSGFSKPEFVLFISLSVKRLRKRSALPAAWKSADSSLNSLRSAAPPAAGLDGEGSRPPPERAAWRTGPRSSPRHLTLEGPRRTRV